MLYVASSTEFVNSRRRKERGTSVVSVGSRMHFLTCHIQYGRRKVNSRSESLPRVIRRSSRPSASREHLMGPSMSVAFFLPAWPIGSMGRYVIVENIFSQVTLSHGAIMT
jgi:hypothetical protein